MGVKHLCLGEWIGGVVEEYVLLRAMELPGTHMAGGASPAAGVGLFVSPLHTARAGILHRGSGVLGEPVGGPCQ